MHQLHCTTHEQKALVHNGGYKNIKERVDCGLKLKFFSEINIEDVMYCRRPLVVTVCLHNPLGKYAFVKRKA